jgi:HEAT repeat protein
MKYFSILELAEQSNFIVIGKVQEIRTKTALIEIEQVLKGRITGKTILISPITVQGCVGSFVNVQINHEIGLFLNKGETGIFTVIENGQGIRELKTGISDKKDSIEAIKQLVKIAPLNEAAKINAMLNLATNSNPVLKSESLNCIATRISSSKLRENYKDALVALLKNKENDIRAAALSGLQFINDEKIIPLIIEATKSNDSRLVNNASLALAQYDTPESVKALIDLTNKENNQDERIRVRACIDLSNSRRQETKETLKNLLEDENPRVRDAAIRSMITWFRLQKADKIIPQIIKMLGDPDEEVKSEAAYALGQSHKFVATEPLLNLLKNKKIGERQEGETIDALYVLYMYGQPESKKLINENVNIIIQSLERGRWKASFSAVSLLAAINTPQAIGALKHAAKNNPFKDIREHAERSLLSNR